MLVAPPGISRAERSRIMGWVRRVVATPTWRENVKRRDWTPFVKTGADLDAFLAAEEKRVRIVVDELGIGK
jgi:putative tricarboxylic transport membrane protein